MKIEVNKENVLLATLEAIQDFILDELVDPIAKVELIHTLGKKFDEYKIKEK